MMLIDSGGCNYRPGVFGTPCGALEGGDEDLLVLLLLPAEGAAAAVSSRLRVVSEP